MKFPQKFCLNNDSWLFKTFSKFVIANQIGALDLNGRGNLAMSEKFHML